MNGQQSFFPTPEPQPQPPVDVDAIARRIAENARLVEEYPHSPSEAAIDQGHGLPLFKELGSSGLTAEVEVEPVPEESADEPEKTEKLPVRDGIAIQNRLGQDTRRLGLERIKELREKYPFLNEPKES